MNGHLISIKPGPQHSHSTSPSGVAPRCGYYTLTCNPVDRYLNETCISFAPFRYSSLAVASFFVPQSKAGTPCKFLFSPITSFTREAGGGFREALLMAANFDAVIRPTQWSNHNLDCDCSRVDSSKYLASSVVIDNFWKADSQTFPRSHCGKSLYFESYRWAASVGGNLRMTFA